MAKGRKVLLIAIGNSEKCINLLFFFPSFFLWSQSMLIIASYNEEAENILIQVSKWSFEKGAKEIIVNFHQTSVTPERYSTLRFEQTSKYPSSKHIHYTYLPNKSEKCVWKKFDCPPLTIFFQFSFNFLPLYLFVTSPNSSPSPFSHSPLSSHLQYIFNHFSIIFQSFFNSFQFFQSFLFSSYSSFSFSPSLFSTPFPLSFSPPPLRSRARSPTAPGPSCPS